jgi:sugar lactone lactonase YvrE
MRPRRIILVLAAAAFPAVLVAPSATAGGPPWSAAKSSMASVGSSPPAPGFPTRLEAVAALYGAMPTGVTVSRHGRIFVNFPRWGDRVPYSVAEIRGGRTVPYPNREINIADAGDPAHHLLGVQSVVVDAADRLWVVDTGRVEGRDAPVGGPKLVAVDLATNRVVRTITVPRQVAGPRSYLNDVRFDLTRGAAGTAYLTDSSSDDLVVVDLATGHARRRLVNNPTTRPVPGFVPLVEGRPLLSRPTPGPGRPVGVGADGIALSPDGRWLYYCPLGSRALYAVSTAALTDPRRTDAQVASTIRNLGEKGMSDGLETDRAGRVYGGDLEHNSLVRLDRDGRYRTVIHDDRLVWPDTLSVGYDNCLYIVANQLNRQAVHNGGKDLRRKPYMVYRMPIGSGPARR